MYYEKKELESFMCLILNFALGAGRAHYNQESRDMETMVAKRVLDLLMHIDNSLKFSLGNGSGPITTKRRHVHVISSSPIETVDHAISYFIALYDGYLLSKGIFYEAGRFDVSTDPLGCFYRSISK